jgi:hypothetical protein
MKDFISAIFAFTRSILITDPRVHPGFYTQIKFKYYLRRFHVSKREKNQTLRCADFR